MPAPSTTYYTDAKGRNLLGIVKSRPTPMSSTMTSSTGRKRAADDSTPLLKRTKKRAKLTGSSLSAAGGAKAEGLRQRLQSLLPQSKEFLMASGLLAVGPKVRAKANEEKKPEKSKRAKEIKTKKTEKTNKVVKKKVEKKKTKPETRPILRPKLEPCHTNKQAANPAAPPKSPATLAAEREWSKLKFKAQYGMAQLPARDQWFEEFIAKFNSTPLSVTASIKSTTPIIAAKGNVVVENAPAATATSFVTPVIAPKNDGVAKKLPAGKDKVVAKKASPANTKARTFTPPTSSPSQALRRRVTKSNIKKSRAEMVPEGEVDSEAEEEEEE